MTRWSGLLLALFISCKSAGIPSNAKTSVLSFAELDCSDCGDDMARALIKEEGVYKTAFDARRAELTIIADPSVDALALAQRKKPPSEEWRLLAGAGKGKYIAFQTPPAGSDVKQLSVDGQDVPDLSTHLVGGKITVFDFSALWCEPCRTLDAHVLKTVEARPDVAYRKLDVGDWDTPLASRYLKGIKQLPYVIVFDKNGKQVDAWSGLDLARFDASIGPPAPAQMHPARPGE